MNKEEVYMYDYSTSIVKQFLKSLYESEKNLLRIFSYNRNHFYLLKSLERAFERLQKDGFDEEFIKVMKDSSQEVIESLDYYKGEGKEIPNDIYSVFNNLLKKSQDPETFKQGIEGKE